MRSKEYQDDTALIRKTIKVLSETQNIDFETAMDIFYNSDVCKALCDEKSGLFTYAAEDIAKLVLQLQKN